MWPGRTFRIAQKLTATEDVAQGKKEAIPRYIDQKQQQYISLYQLVEEFNILFDERQQFILCLQTVAFHTIFMRWPWFCLIVQSVA